MSGLRRIETAAPARSPDLRVGFGGAERATAVSAVVELGPAAEPPGELFASFAADEHGQMFAQADEERHRSAYRSASVLATDAARGSILRE